MVGIGVTGTPKSFIKSRDSILMFNNAQTTIANDKNTLLKQMGSASYIFLFDDDCFPIKEGWEQFFIDAHKKTGIHHFVIASAPHHEKIEDLGVVSTFVSGAGCMLFLTKKAFETVGFMNPKYGKYGYEHAAYSYRICLAGLTPSWYCVVNGWEEYIYSYDLQGEAHGYSKPYVEKDPSPNEQIFREEIYGNQLYYESTLPDAV